MLLSDPAFLFLFLPLVLAGHYGLPKAWRNAFLLVASLYFYAVGEGVFLGILLGICLWNYGIALGIGDDRLGDRPQKVALIVGISGNLMILLYFKYFLDFRLTLKTSLLETIHFPGILDNDYIFLGLSFTILQAVSYLVDVERRTIKPEKNCIDFALYICFFAKITAGPILRYGDLAPSLKQRSPQLAEFTEGIKRFVLGLGKKMILGTGIAPLAHSIFAIPGEHLTLGLAWMGVISFSLWIYYDFSGYSDMAIGLGKMFALPLPENFDYPYTARSVTDFWWRWHRTLACWFQEYIYLPLGGDRVRPLRLSVNWMIVGLLVGIWHGATWNFAILGLYYGLFLALEAIISPYWQFKSRSCQSIYLLVIMMGGWVIFRTDSPATAWQYGQAMVGMGTGDGVLFHLGLYFNRYIGCIMGLGILGCLPLFPWLRSQVREVYDRGDRTLYLGLKIGEFLYLGLIFWLSVLLFPSNLYNYFLYGHF